MSEETETDDIIAALQRAVPIRESTTPPEDIVEENLWLKAAIILLLDQESCKEGFNGCLFDRYVGRVEDGESCVDMRWDGAQLSIPKVYVRHQWDDDAPELPEQPASEVE